MKTRLFVGVQERHELQIAQNILTGKLTISLDGQPVQIVSARDQKPIQVTTGQEEKHSVEIKTSAGFGRWRIAVDGVNLPPDTYAKNEGTVMRARLVLLLLVGISLVWLLGPVAISNGRFDEGERSILVSVVSNMVLFSSLLAVTYAKNRLFSFGSFLLASLILLGDGVWLSDGQSEVKLVFWGFVFNGIIVLLRGAWAAWQNRHANLPQYEQNKDGKWKYVLPPNIAQ